jgi:outer membrane protein assembly factor BamB
MNSLELCRWAIAAPVSRKQVPGVRRVSVWLLAGVVIGMAGWAVAAQPQIEPLGVAIKAVTWVNSHGRLVRNPSGGGERFYIAYYSSTGSALVGVDPKSGERSEAKLGSSGGYGLAVGADQAVYVGGIEPGDLYRYDLVTGQMRNLGGHQFECSYIWDCAASLDGKRIYGAAYPKTKLLEYNTETRELRDLGRMSATEAYSYPVCVDAYDKVWVGIGTHADLVVYDPATGKHESVLPAEFKHNSILYALASSGEYVFGSLLFDGKLLVFDARSRRLVRTIDRPEGSLGFKPALGAPPGELYLYSLPDGTLYHYSVARNRLRKLADALGQCELVKDGRYVYGIDDQDFFLHDLKKRKTLQRVRLAESREGMALCTLCTGKDGFLYGSTYINQHIFRLDPKTGAITDLGKVIRWSGQVDSMCAGRDGRIYMGSYGGAIASVYDPARPWLRGRNPKSNPRELGRMGKGQIRTRACALGPDGNLYVGSIPSYNSDPKGAFSRVNPASNQITVWQDLVPEGAVHAVAADDRYVFGAGGGKLFMFDPQQGKPIWMTNLAVSAMVLGATGDLVGTGNGRLFVFSPTEKRVVLERPCPVGDFSSMCTAPDGSSYGINDSHIARITPQTGEVTELIGQGGTLLTADADSNLYFARGAQVFRLRR